MEPLIHKLAKKNAMPSRLLETEQKIIYDPKSMTSDFLSLGESSTSCAKKTDGTEPKNEADQVMDD